MTSPTNDDTNGSNWHAIPRIWGWTTETGSDLRDESHAVPFHSSLHSTLRSVSLRSSLIPSFPHSSLVRIVNGMSEKNDKRREWGELMPRERSKGNIIQPLGRECSCRSASPFSLLSSSLPVSSPPYHPARTGPFGSRRVSGEKWGRSTSQRKERYGHWAASVSPKFRSFRSSIAPLPRQSSPLPFTTFMSLRLSDGSVAYGTSEERMNVGKRRCQLPACTVRLLFVFCSAPVSPHVILTHPSLILSLPSPYHIRRETEVNEERSGKEKDRNDNMISGSKFQDS